MILSASDNLAKNLIREMPLVATLFMCSTMRGRKITHKPSAYEREEEV